MFVSFDVSDMNASENSSTQEEAVSSESQYADVVADESGRKSSVYVVVKSHSKLKFPFW